jgi:hypothetical protein
VASRTASLIRLHFLFLLTDFIFLFSDKVAIGVPLINAIYESDPLIGLYTLPLLIWHPMQLLIGTFLSPRLLAFVIAENERLGIKDDVGDEDELPPAPPMEIAETALKLESDEEVGLKSRTENQEATKTSETDGSNEQDSGRPKE